MAGVEVIAIAADTIAVEKHGGEGERKLRLELSCRARPRASKSRVGLGISSFVALKYLHECTFCVSYIYPLL